MALSWDQSRGNCDPKGPGLPWKHLIGVQQGKLWRRGPAAMVKTRGGPSDWPYLSSLPCQWGTMKRTTG